MSDVVGQIALELNVDPKAFKKQLLSITDTAKAQTAGLTNVLGGFGKTVLAAFSVKAVADFGKSCLELGSDLAEVKNVVDVTFKTMSDSVNNWAKNAKGSFGISQTVAKQYLGQFGAMSKAVGNTEQLAYDQSTALVGLAGDVASFYNKTVDESMTKLKAVFTGETEGLRDLGVVMSQTALDEFALRTGLEKTTAEMTEQEKVALRLAFVQEKLADAAGDYVRTSDGWANQVKELSLSFDEVKTSLGQGLIVALTPALGILNDFVAHLQTAADAFAQFMVAVFGAEDSGGELATSTAGAASSSAEMAENAENTLKTANKLKKVLAPFDDFNILASADAGSSGSSASSVSSASSSSNVPIVAETPAVVLPALDTAGFDVSLENIKAKISSLGIGELIESFGNFGEMLSVTLPPTLTPFLGIVDDIAFTLGSEIIQGLADLTGSFSDFTGTALPIASEAFKVFYDTGLAPITDWLGQKIGDAFDFASGILDDWTQWFEVNEQAIYDMNSELGELTAFLWSLIEPLADKAWGSFKEALKGISDLFQDFFKWVMDNDEVVVGALVGIGAALTAYKVALGITALIDAFRNGTLLAAAATTALSIAQGALNVVMSLNPIALVVGAITGLVAAFSYLWNTSDSFRQFWIDLWETIKSIASDVWDWLDENVFTPIGEAFSSIWNGIKDVINGMLGGIESFVNFIVGAINWLIDAINSLSFDVPDWVPGIGGKKFGFDLGYVSEVSIPRLATGCYVEANSPRLAIIGDNTREGEIVSPESKIAEQVTIGVAAALRQIIPLLKGGTSQSSQPTQIIIKIGEHEFWSGFVDYHNDIVVRTGESPLLV